MPRALVTPLARLGKDRLVLIAEVVNDHVGLLYLDGVLQRRLEPGRYGFLRGGGVVRVIALDLRLQTLEGNEWRS